MLKEFTGTSTYVGGGVCEFDEDLEGCTLQRLREVVGPDVPIMSSMATWSVSWSPPCGRSLTTTLTP